MEKKLKGRGSKLFILTGLAPPSHPESSRKHRENFVLTENLGGLVPCVWVQVIQHTLLKEGDEKMGDSNLRILYRKVVLCVAYTSV